MATGKVRSRAGGMNINVDVEGVERTTREFREVRRQLATDLSDLEAGVAERTVLPEAQRRASGLRVEGQPVAASLVVRKRRSAPYMTTRLRGKRGRAVGLLEYGGTVRTVIRPRTKQALTINGELRSVVRAARHYRGREFMSGAVDERLGQFGREVREEIVDRFFRPRFEID